MRIQTAFEKAKRENRAALVSYITAGDTSLYATRRYVRELTASGVDIIELGIPFSDPMADGPTNQAAALRALEHGTTLKQVLALVAELRAEGLEIPIVLFSYLNPIYQMGFEVFARQAKRCGVDGVLIVDLPPEEAKSYYLKTILSAGLDTIFLASPTTSPARLKLIEECSTGFIYYISRTGVTGAKRELSQSIVSELKALRNYVSKPTVVGFGISTPAHVRSLVPYASGVVVGSAFVNIIEKTPEIDQCADQISAFTKSLVKELGQCLS